MSVVRHSVRPHAIRVERLDFAVYSGQGTLQTASTCFNLSIEKVSLSAGLFELHFCKRLQPWQGYFFLSAGLQSFTFGSCFNWSMEKVSLSAVLRSFTLCWYFDQTMEKFSLPVGLQSRTFVYGFDQSSDMVTLPVTLPVGVVVQTHLRPRLTVGSINCYGSEGPVHSVFAINVAVLTAARLRTALRLAGGHQAGAFAMQEIRHPENGFRWGGKIAATEGWRVQWSAATSVDHHGVRRQGGTALLWRRELARGAPCRFDAPEHLQSRACGRAWESFWVWSVYGDALKVDFERMGAIQRSAFACPRDRSNGIIVGDFNWKRPTTPRSEPVDRRAEGANG